MAAIGATSATANMASDLAQLGRTEEARTLGEDTRERLSQLLGPDHPLALGCAVNLSLDLKTLGEESAAESLLNVALDSYRRQLGPNHPDTVVASAGRRLDPDFDPPPI